MTGRIGAQSRCPYSDPQPHPIREELLQIHTFHSQTWATCLRRGSRCTRTISSVRQGKQKRTRLPRDVPSRGHEHRRWTRLHPAPTKACEHGQAAGGILLLPLRGGRLTITARLSMSGSARASKNLLVDMHGSTPLPGRQGLAVTHGCRPRPRRRRPVGRTDPLQSGGPPSGRRKSLAL
jgi:hypothetical protein